MLKNQIHVLQIMLREWNPVQWSWNLLAPSTVQIYHSKKVKIVSRMCRNIYYTIYKVQNVEDERLFRLGNSWCLSMFVYISKQLIRTWNPRVPIQVDSQLSMWKLSAYVRLIQQSTPLQVWEKRFLRHHSLQLPVIDTLTRRMPCLTHHKPEERI